MEEKKLDLANLPKNINKELSQEERKEVYKRVKAGEETNNPTAKAYTNLTPVTELDPEKRKEICRKGADAVNKKRRERRNAQEIVRELMSTSAKISANDLLPDDIKAHILANNPQITQYDLIMLAQMAKAREGDTRAAEFLRDTAGDKPINESHHINEIITPADRELYKKLAERMGISQE